MAPEKNEKGGASLKKSGNALPVTWALWIIMCEYIDMLEARGEAGGLEKGDVRGIEKREKRLAIQGYNTCQAYNIFQTHYGTKLQL